MKFKNLLFSFWVCITILMVGCATVPQTSIENINRNTKIDKTAGAVIAETLTNGNNITGRINVWDELIIWRVTPKGETPIKGQETTFSLKALNRNSESQQYMGLIPEGHYHIGLLWAYRTIGDVSYWAKAYVPPAIGTFHVKAGEVTNLGKIIYHPFQARSFFSTSLPDYAITRMESPILLERLKVEHQALFAKYKFEKNNSWDADSFDETRAAASKLMIDSASIKAIHRLDDQLVVTGRLGLIKAPNQWRASFTEETIHDIAAVNAKIWVAGGEFGALFLLTPDGKLIESVAGLNKLEHVYAIERIDDQRFFLLTLKNQAFNFYIYSLVDKKLENIGVHDRNRGFFTSVATPLAIVDNAKIRIYSDSKQQTYDLTTKQWSKIKFKNLYSIVQQKNGLLLATPSDAWSGIGRLLVSKDDGKTWLTYKKVVVPPIYRTLQGQSFTTEDSTSYNFWSGKTTTGDVAVTLSVDDGMTWTPVGKLPEECDAISAEVSTDAQLVSLCRDGRIMASVDLGRTWSPLSGISTQAFELFPKLLRLKYKSEPVPAAASTTTNEDKK